MATAQIAFTDAVHVGGSSVLSKDPRAVETITTSASSQATTATALAGELASITVSGGAIFVKVAAAPTAASGSGYLIPDGGRLDLGSLAAGDKVAVINA